MKTIHTLAALLLAGSAWAQGDKTTPEEKKLSSHPKTTSSSHDWKCLEDCHDKCKECGQFPESRYEKLAPSKRIPIYATIEMEARLMSGLFGWEYNAPHADRLEAALKGHLAQYGDYAELVPPDTYFLFPGFVKYKIGEIRIEYLPGPSVRCKVSINNPPALSDKRITYTTPGGWIHPSEMLMRVIFSPTFRISAHYESPESIAWVRALYTKRCPNCSTAQQEVEEKILHRGKGDTYATAYKKGGIPSWLKMVLENVSASYGPLKIYGDGTIQVELKGELKKFLKRALNVGARYKFKLPKRPPPGQGVLAYFVLYEVSHRYDNGLCIHPVPLGAAVGLGSNTSYESTGAQEWRPKMPEPGQGINVAPLVPADATVDGKKVKAMRHWFKCEGEFNKVGQLENLLKQVIIHLDMTVHRSQLTGKKLADLSFTVWPEKGIHHSAMQCVCRPGGGGNVPDKSYGGEDKSDGGEKKERSRIEVPSKAEWVAIKKPKELKTEVIRKKDGKRLDTLVVDDASGNYSILKDPAALVAGGAVLLAAGGVVIAELVGGGGGGIPGAVQVGQWTSLQVPVSGVNPSNLSQVAGMISNGKVALDKAPDGVIGGPTGATAVFNTKLGPDQVGPITVSAKGPDGKVATVETVGYAVTATAPPVTTGPYYVLIQIESRGVKLEGEIAIEWQGGTVTVKGAAPATLKENTGTRCVLYVRDSTVLYIRAYGSAKAARILIANLTANFRRPR